MAQPQSLLLRNEPPSRPAESLSGLIERVSFHNEENGFAVLKVKAKGHRELVTVVGSRGLTWLRGDELVPLQPDWSASLARF